METRRKLNKVTKKEKRKSYSLCEGKIPHEQITHQENSYQTNYIRKPSETKINRYDSPLTVSVPANNLKS